MKSFWLYLHFPHLQLDTLFANPNQTQSELPVVVLNTRHNTVVQANAVARQAGISLGMGLGTAAALQHDLQVLPYQYEVEHSRLKELASHLYQVTSDIHLFSPNGILLRIHHMLKLYGGLTAYWQIIRRQLAPFHLSYHFATGHSALAAKMLASQGFDTISDDLASLKEAVGRCPLSATELDSKLQQKLTRVGVHRVSDLQSLPLKDLAKRFDAQLVTYLGRLSGEFHHPLQWFMPPSQFERYLELLYEISHSDHLHKPLLSMLTGLEQFLKVRDLLTHSIVLRLEIREHPAQSVQVNSAEGEYQASKWLELSKLKLDSLTLQGPVYGIHLRTLQTHLRCPDKADLFSRSKGSLTDLQLVALLQAKLGETAVLRLVMEDDFRPEKASSYRPVTTVRESQPLNALQPCRPSFLLPEGQPLTEKVRIMEGPERLHTGWWDNHEVVRDYYIARSEQGQWLWIYRTPQNQWYVQGVFS